MSVRLYGVRDDGTQDLVAVAPGVQKFLRFAATFNETLKSYERASTIDSLPLPNGLPIWTIYDHPRDWPDWYVARMFVNDRPTGNMVLDREIEPLRDQLAAWGLTPMARNPDDDPVILEVWV